MANEYALEREAMRKGAQAVDEATVKIDQHTKSLTQAVDAMLASWKGDASKSFGNVHMAWNGQVNKLHGALVEMHGALVSTGSTYGTQEEEHSSMFNNIAGGL